MTAEHTMTDVTILLDGAFDLLVHSENRNRLAALLDRRSRRYRFEFCHEDRSESWLFLRVEEGEQYPV